jgi:hypothetical protein
MTKPKTDRDLLNDAEALNRQYRREITKLRRALRDAIADLNLEMRVRRLAERNALATIRKLSALQLAIEDHRTGFWRRGRPVPLRVIEGGAT